MMKSKCGNSYLIYPIYQINGILLIYLVVFIAIKINNVIQISYNIYYKNKNEYLIIKIVVQKIIKIIKI
jgi:hypothetical protein